MYGVGRNEELVGKAIRDRRERGLSCDQVRQCARRERRVPRRQAAIPIMSARPARRACGDWASSHRPLLPAPRRPERADRGDGRRDGAVEAGGEGSLPRPVGSGAATIRRRMQRTDRRCSDRAVAVEPRRGRGCPSTVRELGIGYVAYSPLGRGFLTGQITSRRIFRMTTTGAFTPASPARISRRTSHSSARSRRWLGRRAARRRNSRSPGC